MNPFSRQAGVAMRLLTLCVCLSSLGLASCTPKAFQTLVPLYRILHEGYSVDHCVTAGPAERDHAVANDGYVDEGVMGFVYSVQQPGTFEKGVRPLFSNQDMLAWFHHMAGYCPTRAVPCELLRNSLSDLDSRDVLGYSASLSSLRAAAQLVDRLQSWR